MTALAPAAYRANHAARDAYRQERSGFRGGTAIRTVKRPHWSRRPAGAGANAVVRHRLLGACRIHLHWRLNTEHPPVAGALREQPKALDRPKKGETSANAVPTQALCSRAAPPRSTTIQLQLHDGPSQLACGSWRLCDAFVTAPCLQTPNPAEKPNNKQSKA